MLTIKQKKKPLKKKRKEIGGGDAHFIMKYRMSEFMNCVFVYLPFVLEE